MISPSLWLKAVATIKNFDFNFPDKSNERTCSIVLEICQDVAVTGSTSSSRVPEMTFIISSLKVTAELTWSALEHLVNGAFMSHLNDISIGLKTKKTSRYDQDSPDLVLPYSLGLSTDSIKHYVIGKRGGLDDWNWYLGHFKKACELLFLCSVMMLTLYKIISFNVWETYFVWNSKVSFEIPLKISYPYFERYVFIEYRGETLRALWLGLER